MTTEKEFYRVITEIILRVLEENNVKLKKIISARMDISARKC